MPTDIIVTLIAAAFGIFAATLADLHTGGLSK
jgi:hypothetical protein